MHPLDEMKFYLRYCLVLPEMDKLVEYLLLSRDELYGTLSRRPLTSLFALYKQGNRMLPPEELPFHELITHLQDQLVPRSTASPDLSVMRSAIRSQASLEEIVGHFQNEFWRTLGSIPFGAWVSLATGYQNIPRCVQPLLAAVDEARELFSSLSPAGRLDNDQLDLFHPAPRSMMSIVSAVDYEDSLVSLSKHIVGTIPGFVPRAHGNMAPSTSESASIIRHVMQHLYFLDIIKVRLQDACQQRTNFSWSRVLFSIRPPLGTAPDLVDTAVEQMTDQHSVLLQQLTEKDIVECSQKFLDTCILSQELSCLAAEVVRARKETIPVVLAYVHVSIVESMDCKALTLSVVHSEEQHVCDDCFCCRTEECRSSISSGV